MDYYTADGQIKQDENISIYRYNTRRGIAEHTHSSHCVGYHDRKQFYKIFKEYMGVIPSSLRRSL